MDDEGLMIPKKGHKKAAVRRTTAKGQNDAAGSAALKEKLTPVLENQKGKGPIPLSVDYRQEAGPFPFVGEIITCAVLQAVQAHSQYHEKQSLLRSWQ